MKTCRKCGVVKPLSEYHVNKSYRDGLQGKCKTCVRDYQQTNRPAIAAKERAWRAANTDHVADRRRRYYATNAAAVSVYNRGYHAANPHKGWERLYRQRVRRYGFEPVVEQFTRDELIENYGDACWHCGDEWAELDHYPKPVSQGGSHTLDNCRPSCRPCNRRGTRKVAA